jgi:steroid 5-alpha reductase family enzyme
MLTSITLTDLGIALALCLAISSLGFRRVDHFISLGYGFSIAAQAVVFPLLHFDRLDGWRLAQSALLLAYGMRLGLFLMARERAASFATELEASKLRAERVRGLYKILIWVAVSLLYVAMYAPAQLALASPPGDLWSLAPGVVVMALGLGLEAASDWQKSALKAKAPKRFVSSGLFGIVRSPNYFGEMLFWLGTFISGMAAYQVPGDWVVALIGLVCIELIMVGSARRLELKQAERYAADPAYGEYARRVPVLFPLLPLYSLRNWRIYLG